MVLGCMVMALWRPSAVSAQAPGGLQVHLSPSLGVSLPFGGPFIDEASLKKHPVAAAVFAARLAVTPTPHLGVQASLALGRGLVAVRDSLNTVTDIPSTVVLSSLKGALHFNPHTRTGVSMHVSSGLGLIARSGRAWADTRPPSVVPAWVMSAGGSARLSRRGSVYFRFELEDFISRARFNVGLPTETRALWHHDLIWSLGFMFPILGR